MYLEGEQSVVMQSRIERHLFAVKEGWVFG
jgi:hypothetical protein